MAAPFSLSDSESEMGSMGKAAWRCDWSGSDIKPFVINYVTSQYGSITVDMVIVLQSPTKSLRPFTFNEGRPDCMESIEVSTDDVTT